MGLSMYKGFAFTHPGYSHEAKDAPCQDAAECTVGDAYAIAAISDGHGGEKYFRSKLGSFFAVKTATHCLENFLENHRASLIDVPETQWRKSLKDIENNIIYNWRSHIKRQFKRKTLTPEEKELCARYNISADKFKAHFYGATLLYACMTPDYSFASQIGDGACVSFEADGTPCLPMPEDDRLGFSVTTSLCDSDPSGNFRRYFWPASKGLPRGIFLCTDGVVDSYERDSFLRFNRIVFDEMHKNEEHAKKQLEEWLPKLSEQGSRDDVSMAGVYSDDESESQDI